MLFMNECEIEQARLRYENNPILGEAARVLSDFKDLVNEKSDGWCYWSAPLKAARNLMLLFRTPSLVKEADVKKALRPIKSFCTRRKFPFPDANYRAQKELEKLGGPSPWMMVP